MKIHYLNGPQAGRRIELSAEGATIGREQDNQIQLLIGGVSRYHAKIENKDGSWFLRDLGSTNGTRINDVLITEATRLNHGDHVVIGDQQFRIELLAHAPAVTDTDADSTRAFPAPEPTSPAFVFRPDVMPPTQPPPPPVSPAAPREDAPAPQTKTPEAEKPDQTLKVNFDDQDIFKSDSGFGGDAASSAGKKKSKNTLVGNIIFAVVLVVMIVVGVVLIHHTMSDTGDTKAKEREKAAAASAAKKKEAQESFFFYYERVLENKKSGEPNIFKVVAQGEYKFRKVKGKGKDKGKDKLKKYFELKVSLRDLANEQKFDSIPMVDISLNKVEQLQNRLAEEILESSLHSSSLTGDSCFDRIAVCVNGKFKDVIFYNGDGKNNSYFGTAQDALDDFISDAIGMPLMMTKEEIVKEAEEAYNDAVNAGNYQDDPQIFHRAFKAYERACLFYERLNSPRLGECKAKYTELEKYYKDKYRSGKNEVERYYKDRQFQRASDLCDENMKFFPEGTKEYNFFRESKITINGERRKFDK